MSPLASVFRCNSCAGLRIQDSGYYFIGFSAVATEVLNALLVKFDLVGDTDMAGFCLHILP